MCSNGVGSKLKNGKEFGHVTLYMQYLFYSDIATTYLIVGNFRWCKFSREMNACALTTPQPVDCHAPHAKRRYDTERQKEGTNLCNKGPVSELPSRARNWLVNQFSSFRLRQLRRVSYGFVGILYSSRLILSYSDNSEGRQTVENHLVHTGTSSYAHSDVINYDE